jgi:hypothetical protein
MTFIHRLEKNSAPKNCGAVDVARRVQYHSRVGHVCSGLRRSRSPGALIAFTFGNRILTGSNKRRENWPTKTDLLPQQTAE